MQEPLETQVWTLGQEDPLEEEMATHSSILAWEIPRIEGPGGLQAMVTQKSLTRLSDYNNNILWRLKAYLLQAHLSPLKNWKLCWRDSRSYFKHPSGEYWGLSRELNHGSSSRLHSLWAVASTVQNLWAGLERREPRMKKMQCSLGCLQAAHLHKDIFVSKEFPLNGTSWWTRRQYTKPMLARPRALPQEAAKYTDPANSRGLIQGDRLGPRTSFFCRMLTGNLL